MTLHKPSGRWQLGLGLSLVTVFFWGILPLALKLVLDVIDPVTLMWFRFLVAGAFIAVTLGRRGALPRLRGRTKRSYGLLSVAMIGLLLNYLFFTMGLHWTTPETAQVLIQLSPIMFLIGSVMIFGERLALMQVAGLVVLVVGLGLFFHHRLGDMLQFESQYALGVGCILLAGITWAAYALAQKQLLTEMPSPAIMLFVYVGSAIFSSVAAHPTSLGALTGVGIALLVFTAANTIVAYGAFAEALAHWEASRVSAVLALTPIVTIITMHVGHWLWPTAVAQEPLPALSYLGAAMVVAGSMLASLARSPSRITKPPEWRTNPQPTV